MLSPRKNKMYSDEKVLPTIDLMCPDSLHAWLELRKLALNFGLKFFRRHELFLVSVGFVFAISIMLFLELALFHIVIEDTGNIEHKKL